ncbi:permease [Desulfovibrio aminophilus]|uniref:permease n=1 Tax=Desulfovibrio aminophilus TaxID=81425 RepID=UPI00055889A1|nr:permease [Desulfovibrio aminophilus]
MDFSGLQAFAAVVTAIVLEAAPFLLLGSLAAGAVEAWMPEGALDRLLPKHRAGRVLAGLLAGFLLPACECGIVPLARRLLRKGVPVAAALPYMLAAPVVNPISMLATWVAFRGDWGMVLGRVALVAVPAAALGLALGDRKARDILAPGLDMAHDAGCSCRAHGGAHGGSKLLSALRHAAEEFLDMSRFLVLGAVASAIFKVFLPQGVLEAVAGSPLGAVAALMLLAVLLSICSQADAFVAASLTMFPRGAQLAFLALGPMLDLKLIPAYLAVFRRPVFRSLVVVPTVLIFVLCALLTALWG